MPRRQRVAVYGICRDQQGNILLTRAAPYLTVAGRWFLPGGGINFGESPEDGLVREFSEETGLTVTIGPLLGVLSDTVELPDGTKLHTVRICYEVASWQGSLRAEKSGSTDAVEWIPEKDLSDLLVMPYVERALAQFK